MCRQINYRDGFPLMEITKPELRKMLNKLWNKARYGSPVMPFTLSENSAKRRYRDVSKIIKEAEKAKE